jgi:DNA polymerase V
MDDEPPAKKEIACTRSFGAPVRDLLSLQEAVTGFATRAAHKLRSQESFCGQVLVFIRTSPFRARDRQYSRSLVVPLRAPTADTGQICQAALLGLERIYQPGFNYAKGGVMLLELQPQSIEQARLDLGDAPPDRSELMSAVDRLDERFGRGTVGYASGGARRSPRAWAVKSDRRTPRYTTHWDEMAVARA